MGILVLLVSAAAVAIDQVLKSIVVQNLKPDGNMNAVPGFLRFIYVENRGAAFGILLNQQWLFITVTAVICILIIFALFRYTNHEFFSYAACALIIGGGIGNLIDRVHNNFVVDYISVSFFPPVFNFADCCVTVGTVFLIIHLLFFYEKGRSGERVIRSR